MMLKSRAVRAFVLLMVAAALTAPLAWSSEESSQPEKKDSSQELRKELDEAYDAIKQYSIDKKAEFVAWAEARIKELDKKIDELNKEIDEAGEDAKEQWQETLESLKEERTELRKKLEEVKKSGKDAWADIKWGFSAAYEKLEKAYEKALRKFKGQDEEDPEKSDPHQKNI